MNVVHALEIMGASGGGMKSFKETHGVCGVNRLNKLSGLLSAKTCYRLFMHAVSFWSHSGHHNRSPFCRIAVTTAHLQSHSGHHYTAAFVIA